MANHHHHHQNDNQNCQKKGQVVVVMVPFPAQGHLNQLLNLSHLISSYDIPVHYVCTTTHSRQAKLRVHGWNPLSSTNIHFHEFPTPSFLSPPPNPNSSTKFPSHLLPSFKASSLLRDPVGSLLQSLSSSAKSRRIIVIHDSLMGSVIEDVASLPNADVYTLHTVSSFFSFTFQWENMGRPFPIDDDILKDLPSREGCFTSEFEEFVKTQHAFTKLNSGRIYNTCREIEGAYIDLLAKDEISRGKKLWSLGPFNPVAICKNKKSSQKRKCLRECHVCSSSKTMSFNKNKILNDNDLWKSHLRCTAEELHPCLEWLDDQSPNSVIFVSFGTTTSLSGEQIEELATGLEQSEQKFIWLLRDADKGDVFEGEVRSVELPKGFEERVKGKGLVVRDWAPQLEILGHQSTGGFMSHCGWNSCMESITMGVPIAAWPMHSDQPRNSVLITKWLKVGLVVKDWARRDELVTSSMVEQAVKRLMASEEGDEMRKKAAELCGSVRKSVADGGGARMQLDSFIAHISR